MLNDNPILKLKLRFDILQLRKDLKYVTENFPIVLKHPGYGGWALTSSTGEVADGFYSGQVVFNSTLSPEKLQEMRDFLANRGPETIKTSACVGGFQELLRILQDACLEPSRVRVLRIWPGSRGSPPHKDASGKNGARYRLIIPINTNPDAVMLYGNVKYHLPASGAGYLVRIDLLHEVLNNGTEFRDHIVADINHEHFIANPDRFCDLSI